MKRRHVTSLLALSIASGLGAIACSQTTAISPTDSIRSATVSDADPPTTPVTLTISAAASVQDALQEIQVIYEAQTPGVTITYNFGSSGSLAQQIAQGAPVDVFLSASKQWMDTLERKGDIVEVSRSNLLRNEMVLIRPRNGPTILDFKDLNRDGVIKVAIGEPGSVPAGRYAKEVLSALDLFDTLQPKLVFGKDVRQVLSYVETGNVDAGLVYATDALMSDRIDVLATAPAETHAPIVYPIAVVQDSPNAAAAEAFLAFLFSDAAADIFEGYGFSMML